MSVARFAVVLALALVACGDDDADRTGTSSAAASAAAASTSTSTTLPVTTLPVTAPPVTAPPVTVSCGSGLSIDSGAPLRDQFVAYLASCGFTDAEAACLFDNLDFTDAAVAGGESAPIVAAFGACAIDQARAAEIGG